MESAIPAHLRSEQRTQRSRLPDGYVPPYPSYVARHATSVKRVVMAYLGLQYRGDPPSAASAAQRELDAALGDERAPGHWDRARYVDEAGFTNVVSIAYWDQPAAFDAWFARHGAHWARRTIDGAGTFVEVLRPSVERYETLFSSNDRAEGIAVLAEGMSDTVQEHAYWGGARDRIPLSQTDALASSGEPQVIADGALRRVVPHDGVCLIRSGQDWSDTDSDERRMYLEDVEPVLREGMRFLRDEGLAIGCYANRYMRVVDRDGRDTDKSFGMSWWTNLAALERWAESHPTHVAIFGAAMKYLSTLGPAAKLRLYHEVTVATASEQLFEYRNCHDRTGMLRAGR